MTTNRNALVVLSGGQDSTTCLYWAKENFEHIHALTFNYGQRHAREIEAARTVAHMAGVDSHEILDISTLLGGTSFLTDKSRPVETFDSFEAMSHHNAFKQDKLDSSFVPGRNLVFLSLAANRAVVHDCAALVTGVTAADFAEYGEFSWEWLGGFVDAEGMFDRCNGDKWRLIIYQKDPELLRRLKDWLASQTQNFTASIDIDKQDCAQLYIGQRAMKEILPLLSPHLHSPHRRNQATQRGAELVAEFPLTDAYVAGFWEGDGGCNGKFGTKGGSFRFEFYQKDIEILEKIQRHLGRGKFYQSFNPMMMWSLELSENPLFPDLWNRMKPHLCALNSFQKYIKARHRLDMPGGSFNPPYPDCTPDFIWSLQKAMVEALRTPFTEPLEIFTPLMYLTKAQSVRLAQKLQGCMEALAYSHTAYSGEYPPLTKDHANMLRAQGFLEAGIPDPLIIRAWREGLMPLPATPNYQGIEGAA